MGLYPPTKSPTGILERELKLLESGKGMPPLKIRNQADHISEAKSDK
jgi:hypothetical protein